MDGKLRQGIRDRFLEGMSHAACTVNIVTTDGPAGRAGVTVSAMASVSADSEWPTMLVCVHQLSPAATRIVENGLLCVNVLRDDQSYISDTFAGRFKHQVDDKFDCAQWMQMPSGAPRVVDPLVGFDCKVISSNQIGTHYVLFGEVGDIFIAERGSPLIYANRAYGAANRIEPVAAINAAHHAAAAPLSIGCFHTFGPYILPEMISRLRSDDPDLKVHLVEGDQRRVQESLLAGEVELALLYDIGLADGLVTEPLTRLMPYVLLADGHPLAQKAALTPADLADQSMILLNSPPSRDYFTGILEAAGITPNIAFRSSNFEMVRGLVGHGLGYSLLATKPASSMTYDGKALISRPLITTSEPGRVVLALRKGTNPSPTAERFMWFCREFFCLDH